MKFTNCPICGSILELEELTEFMCCHCHCPCDEVFHSFQTRGDYYNLYIGEYNCFSYGGDNCSIYHTFDEEPILKLNNFSIEKQIVLLNKMNSLKYFL